VTQRWSMSAHSALSSPLPEMTDSDLKLSIMKGDGSVGYHLRGQASGAGQVADQSVQLGVEDLPHDPRVVVGILPRWSVSQCRRTRGAAIGPRSCRLYAVRRR
jgi:hypothetical protein